MNLWSCPHTPKYCGESETIIAREGTGTIKPLDNYGEWLNNGQICKYKVVFPREAANDDVIVVKPQKLTRITMSTVDTYRYRSNNFTETYLAPGESVTFKHPNVLFIMLMSDVTSSEPADFQFTYEYVPKLLPHLVPGSLESLMEENAQYFFGAIGAGFIFIILLIVALCCAFTCIKEKNNKL